MTCSITGHVARTVNNTRLPFPPKSLVLAPPPEYPFQAVVADLFQLDGHTYMAYADHLTGWVEVAHFSEHAPSSKIITHLRRLFRRWGALEHLFIDGGTNLASNEVTEFLRKWGVTASVLCTLPSVQW